MQSNFFRAICQMGIFMICAQSIIHFRPKGSYEKYLKMLVSVMLLIQLFMPVGRLILGNGNEEFARRVEQFEENLEKSMKAAEESAVQSQKQLEEMTLEEVRTRLETEQKTQEQEAQDNTAQSEKFSITQGINIEPVEPISIEAGPETD